jgi:uncharacterized protein
MPPLVLYHAACADGFCAAWVARRKMPDAECVPVQYGQPPPDVAGRDVYILDFCYKGHVLLEMAKSAAQVLILDHHKTAAADLDELHARFDGSIPPTRLVSRFDINKSGGRLAWEHFFKGEPAPWLVDYTEDRDLWRWKLPLSREVSAALSSYPHDFAVWDRLAEFLTPTLLAGEGTGILRYQARQVESACAHAALTDVCGHKVLAVNATTLQSEIAGKLAEGRPFGACYFIRADGKKVWSLRSTPEGIDVSEVAKKYGGGGHKHAAGFEGEP